VDDGRLTPDQVPRRVAAAGLPGSDAVTPAHAAPADVLAEAGRITARETAGLAWLRWHAAAAYERGWRDGYERRAAELERDWRDVAGPVAAGGPSFAELERRRWELRGEARTRETFGGAHAGDYPGQGAA